MPVPLLVPSVIRQIGLEVQRTGEGLMPTWKEYLIVEGKPRASLRLFFAEFEVPAPPLASDWTSCTPASPAKVTSDTEILSAVTREAHRPSARQCRAIPAISTIEPTSGTLRSPPIIGWVGASATAPTSRKVSEAPEDQGLEAAVTNHCFRLPAS
jgi:hypothetical protein